MQKVKVRSHSLGTKVRVGGNAIKSVRRRSSLIKPYEIVKFILAEVKKYQTRFRSSTKLEVLSPNVSKRCKNRTETALYTGNMHKNLVKFGRVTFELCERTNRQTVMTKSCWQSYEENVQEHEEESHRGGRVDTKHLYSMEVKCLASFLGGGSLLFTIDLMLLVTGKQPEMTSDEHWIYQVTAASPLAVKSHVTVTWINIAGACTAAGSSSSICITVN